MARSQPLITSSIAIALSCSLLLTGCSSLIIHDDDNIAVVAGKLGARTANCALTIFMLCASEWIWMEEAKRQSVVWYGNGDIHGDNYRCQLEASSNSPRAPAYIHMPMGQNVMSLPVDTGGGPQINQQLYHACMRAHGYSLVDSHDLARWKAEQTKGSHCVSRTTTIGTQLRTSEGQTVKVTEIYGPSSRCSDPATPVLVDAK